MTGPTKTTISRQPEPRWPAAIAVIAAASVHYVLPRSLVPGPPWIVLGLVTLLVVLAIFARRRRKRIWNERLSYLTLGVLTLALIGDLGGLLWALPRHLEPPKEMLGSAALLWVTNVVVFACWYWRLDAGGPNERDFRETHVRGAFLFPQMLLPGADASVFRDESLPKLTWRPGFLDYLFLAFNTSTAFSPTDVPVLSRWAKGMMMVQSCISLTSVVVVAARAVNVL
ncbi:MAG TPA: hypothetical protein VJO33_12050 [Gemmatimonadaceae bacterium]|nr:hypothetical protein [Gemmatimonadaceae bacterium]